MMATPLGNPLSTTQNDQTTTFREKSDDTNNSTRERDSSANRVMLSPTDQSSKVENSIKDHEAHRPQTSPQTASVASKFPSRQQKQQRKKRKICERCHRPFPQTCLCASLPKTPIRLTTTEVVVVQHPLELKNHKASSHRSIPLLELCLNPESLVLTIGRRFGTESLGPSVWSKLWGKDADSYLPVLVFPKIAVPEDIVVVDNKEIDTERGEKTQNTNRPRKRYREDESTVLSLKGLQEFRESSRNSSNTATCKKKILLLVLDATWKHAREMHLANLKADQYPPHMLRLALEREDFGGGFVSGRFRLRGKVSKTGYKQQQQTKKKKRKRDDDEAAIDETWMSTAECIAWILSNLEGCGATYDNNDDSVLSPSLYETLMKPLDAMVAKWDLYRSKGKEKPKADS